MKQHDRGEKVADICINKPAHNNYTIMYCVYILNHNNDIKLRTVKWAIFVLTKSIYLISFLNVE